MKLIIVSLFFLQAYGEVIELNGEIIHGSRHENGGGFKSSEAQVDKEAYLGPKVKALDGVKIQGQVRVTGNSIIKDRAELFQGVRISNSTIDSSLIMDNSKVSQSLIVNSIVQGHAQITNTKLITSEVKEKALVFNAGTISNKVLAGKNCRKAVKETKTEKL